MLTNLFESTTIPVLEQVVNFAQSRHNVLAGNIANISTPGYRTRDLSVDAFESRLKEAITARDSGRNPPAQAGYADALTKVGKGLAGILHHDESNVGIEQQAAELSKNQLQHNMALSILTSQFRLLQTAVSERVG